MLHYHLEFKEAGTLSLQIEEKGIRRTLYLDTFRLAARGEDERLISLLVKIHLRSANAQRDTLSFSKIDIPASSAKEALQLLSQSGRLFYQKKSLSLSASAKVYWRGDGSAFSPFLQIKEREIPLEACAKLFPGWFIEGGAIGEVATNVPWKWIELFSQGTLVLEGAQKRRFLEDEPPILWKEKAEEKPLEVFPELVLKDRTGCFADLWMNYPNVGRVGFEDLAPQVGKKGRLKEAEKNWERDLLETAFIRKQISGSHYYAPSDKAEESLALLLDCGWRIFDFRGRPIFKQTEVMWEIGKDFEIKGHIHFGKESAPVKAGILDSKWVELKEGVGLLDRKKILSFEGDWEGDVLKIPKERIGSLLPLLDEPQVKWEETVRKAAEKLRDGKEPIFPGEGFKGTLLPYQQKGLEWLALLYKSGFSALLADEMGLGKTVQVLAFFSTLRTNLPILVIAPTSLLYNWRSEIRKFLPDLPVYVHSGSERSSDLQGHPLILTSYSILRIDEELFSKMEFEVVVLDESGAIKTANTQTSKAACSLRGRFKVAINGTPVENRKEEIFSQFRFLMPALLGEKSAFQAAEAGLIRNKLKPFVLRRTKEEVQIDLPEKIDQVVWIEMEEAQREVYEKYRSRLKSNLLKKIEKDGMSAHRMEVLEAILRLRQIAADPRLVGEEVCGAKIKQLLDDLEEPLMDQRKVLIYSQFTSMLELIGKELAKRGWEYLYLDGSIAPEKRGELVDRFQSDPEAGVFLLSLKAGGVGLNLTAADYVFLFDPWWNEAVEMQAIDRAHRIGRKETVFARRYLLPNTIEEKMLHLKSGKLKVAESLLDGESFEWSEEELLNLLS